MLLLVMGLLTSSFCILEKEWEKGLEGNFKTFAWIQGLLKLLQFLNLLDWTAIAFLSRDVVKMYFSFIPLNLLNWTNLYICLCCCTCIYTRHVWIHKWLSWLEDLVFFSSADRPTPPNTLSHSNGAANSWKSGTERRLSKVAEQCRPCSV